MMKQKLICICLFLSVLCSILILPAGAEDQSSTGLVFGTTISAGDYHMSAVLEDGSLWVWGINTYGALGGENVEDSPLPVKLLENVSSTIAGTSGVYGAIMQNGDLWNWGIKGYNGRLGRQASGWYIEPAKAMEKVYSVDMGSSHTIALKADGSVWVWGSNQYGQLGNGQNGLVYDSEWQHYKYEPLPFKAMTGILSIEAGHRNTFAIDYEGTLWAWGENDEGQLGADRFGDKTIYPLKGTNVGFLCQTTPVRIMDNVEMVNAKKLTAIVKKDGSLWTCGQAVYDEQYQRHYYPVKKMDNVVFAAAGESEYAAICTDGSLWTWGENYYGQLGIGEGTDEVDEPQKIMDDVVSVTIGINFMAALKSDGSLWTWGSNEYGQLGNGTTESSFTPQKVLDGVAIPTSHACIGETLGAGLREDWLNARFFNGNAYILYPSPRSTWDDAHDFCRKMGGHLATVSSAAEEDFLNGFSRYSSVWLGGKSYGGTTWNWVTNESWKYDHWANGEPKKAISGIFYLALTTSGEWETKSDSDSPLGFICEWEGGADTAAVPSISTCAIEFDPCFFRSASNQVLKSRVKTGVPGEKYGTLPTPSQDGYYFEGWFTEKEGGKLITPSSIIEQRTNHTLYAHWSSVFTPPLVSDLTYAFANSNSAFSYPDNYRIPYSQYIRIFGSTNTARELYDRKWYWGGSCYGMSATALMFFMDNEINTYDFRYSATKPAQLYLSDLNRDINYTLLDLIECVHISQLSIRLAAEKQKNSGEYARLVQSVLDFRKNGTDPIEVSMHGPVSGGHSVVAISVWRDDKAGKDVLQVYDPNFPGDTRRYIDLYWDTPGHYTGWHYVINDAEHWGTSYGSPPLSFRRYSTMYSVWADRGSEAAYTSSLIQTNSSEASVYDYDGNLLAEIHDGEFVPLSCEIVQIRLCEEDRQPDSSGVVFYAPEGYYYLVNKDSSIEKFSVTFTSGEHAMTVTTDSSGVMGRVNRSSDSELAFVDGLNRQYDILFRTPEGEKRINGLTDTEVTSCFRFQTGQLASSILVSQQDSEMVLASVSDMMTREDPATVTAVFKDVRKSDAFVQAVRWVWENRIMSAVSAGLFMPDKTCSIDDAVMYLWRSAGQPQVNSGETASFDARMVALGIPEETISPEEPCTLSMFLSFLWHAADKPGFADEEFADYQDAWTWAEKTGLLDVLPGSREPSSAFTRADAAILLFRVFE